MSYGRQSGGNECYVYLNVGGFLTCCGCNLTDKTTWGKNFDAYTTDEMVAHVKAHMDAGGKVADYLIPNLLADKDQNDAWIAAKKRGVSDAEADKLLQVFESEGGR